MKPDENLVEFENTIALPINRSLSSTHWVLAVLPSKKTPEKVLFFDPKGYRIDDHSRKVIEYARLFLSKIY